MTCLKLPMQIKNKTGRLNLNKAKYYFNILIIKTIKMCNLGLGSLSTALYYYISCPYKLVLHNVCR